MKDIALAHGFTFSHTCNCAIRGDIYMRGKTKLKVMNNNYKFILTINGCDIAGTGEQMEGILIQHGL